jgi:23S rRNA (pseudouridine1915-N3)-methyltransferase
MRITIAVVGRGRAGPESAIFEVYRRRCPWPIRLVETAPGRATSSPRQQDEEAERLLRAVAGGEVDVALDERGRDLDSRDFADHISRWRDEGRRDLAFLVGGPDGLAGAVLDRADLKLALGRMTWPHRLVPALLAEQLYRASSILSGHPYHRS